MGIRSLVEQELRSLQKELAVLSQINEKRAHLALDKIEVRGAALSLTSLYNGMERILTQIVIDRNESVSESANWHQCTA